MLTMYKVPDGINYIGVFLTFRCNFGCSYCINRFGELKGSIELSEQSWIAGLSRLITRPDLPITFGGGEPTLHTGLYRIADHLSHYGTNVDLLTNGDFRTEDFCKKVETHVFQRKAKYASIRFSFHPDVHDAHALASKVYTLQTAGYSVGIWGLDHPNYSEDNENMKKICRTFSVDFRLKEFLGYDIYGIWHGSMKYPEACGSSKVKSVSCKTTEILIDPAGKIYRCHADLYAGRDAIGHILDADPKRWGIGEWRRCDNYGACNPCDVKVKFDRHQVMGHTSVEIKEVGDA